MLTDYDRARIREEEIFRRELQASMTPPQPAWWTFVNTGFGLWLLATITLGSITFLYSYYNHAVEESRRQIEREQVLQAELAGRAVAWYRWIQALPTITEDQPTREQIIDVLKTPPARSEVIYGVYPELAGHPFDLLFKELGAFAEDRKAWSAIQDMVNNPNQPSEMTQGAREEYAGKIGTALAIYREPTGAS